MGLLRRFIAQIKLNFKQVQRSAIADIDFEKLEKVLQYPIYNRKLISEALTHRSFLQVHDDQSIISNERLEFLGDAVLSLVVGEYLFHKNTSAAEGELTKLRSRLVNRKALCVYAQELKLTDFILMSPNAMRVHEKGLNTILSDAYEALLGAVYLDGGYDRAKGLAERTMLAAIRQGVLKIDDANFKSQLLELAQSKGLGVPRYSTIHEEGPDHDRIFTVEVHIAGTSYGTGKGTNKKDAEQSAAEAAVQILSNLE
jgi:ribonuclease III